MVDEGEGKFVNSPTQVDRKEYDRFYIYIPISVAKDSAFPFKDGEKVWIRIDGEQLIVEHIKKGKADLQT